ncbi:class I glutamine amidotransferase-like protein [Myriangium duriaei CBS 260.36]|uniref:Class I glutamine amidotransferase-like protein n=1 Tax=Myriangium duriaei CBS 260.36 TaxID=1168546 RepID=A0A9P4MEJ3_9PEZI|nr:class I glutamine amidotransferase-like protein [Myriangium duriaei CBS 260.36]
MAPKAIICLADYGSDPSEVAIPYRVFSESGLDVSFATETGAAPACDSKMLTGITGSLLGATAGAKADYRRMAESEKFKAPLSWSAADFDLRHFDLVLLPGGHDKAMRQYIDSKSLHKQLLQYVNEVRAGAPNKNLAAICHGVQVLASAKDESGKSIIHDFETTALPGFMETSISWATWPFLGDYYKTYGSGTPNVEDFVKAGLDNPAAQWKSSTSFSPFTHRDSKYRYISARFPPDADKFATEAVEMVKGVRA